MWRTGPLLLMLLCLGCESAGVDRQVSVVLDNWSDAPSVSASGVDETVGDPAVYEDLSPGSPLPWPDLDAATKARQLVGAFGVPAVVSALEAEYLGSTPPRRMQALCLISLVDGASNRWFELWQLHHRAPK